MSTLQMVARWCSRLTACAWSAFLDVVGVVCRGAGDEVAAGDDFAALGFLSKGSRQRMGWSG